MIEVYDQLAEALNRLHDETEVEVLSIQFSRSDVPLDWDDETRRWVVGE